MGHADKFDGFRVRHFFGTCEPLTDAYRGVCPLLSTTKPWKRPAIATQAQNCEVDTMDSAVPLIYGCGDWSTRVTLGTSSNSCDRCFLPDGGEWETSVATRKRLILSRCCCEQGCRLPPYPNSKGRRCLTHLPPHLPQLPYLCLGLTLVHRVLERLSSILFPALRSTPWGDKPSKLTRKRVSNQYPCL